MPDRHAPAAAVAQQPVVVGGGLSGAGDLLLAPARDLLSGHLAFRRRPGPVLIRTVVTVEDLHAAHPH